MVVVVEGLIVEVVVDIVEFVVDCGGEGFGASGKCSAGVSGGSVIVEEDSVFLFAGLIG